MYYIESLNISSAEKYMILSYLGYINQKGEQIVKSYINGLKLSKEGKAALLEYSEYEQA